MDTECPHNYYPRPQLKRNNFYCLNGQWDLGIGGENTGLYPYRITVPFCPESPASGVRRDVLGKTLNYRKKFTLPADFNKGKILLHFGAVDQVCSVYLNGVLVGSHEGGYLPFSINVTDNIVADENELTVVAFDDLDHKYPWGKQKKDRGGMWYTPVSGIWQTVWIESTAENAIERLVITPTDRGADISVMGGIGNYTLTLLESGECFSFDGNTVSVRPETVRKWTPDDPYLYRFTIRCDNDEVESYFAIRTVDIREIDGVKRICLNGNPYIFNGLLDQGYYPDGIYMPATVDGYIDDIKLVKSMGFNMLRKHIKIEPMIFYYLCDSMGIAVFQDMVNNGDYSFIRDTALPTIGLQRMNDSRLNRDAKTREIFLRSMEETVEHLYNSPSIVYYTVFNEGWGQFCADSAYDVIKAADPTRIIDTTSGWFRRTRSDVDSRHIYFKPLKINKPDGSPLVISEFGGYSHRVPDHCFGPKNYGYRSFSTAKELEDAIAALYEKEVKPLVDAGASAFVYTQVSDVEDETNGFVTYDRKVVKVDTDRMLSVMKNIFN